MSRSTLIWPLVVFLMLLAGCSGSDMESSGDYGSGGGDGDPDIDPWPEPDPEVIPFDQVEQMRLLNVAHLPDIALFAFVLEVDGGFEDGEEADGGVEE